MNSWHLSLTILAFCTVPALAAEENVKLRAVANISLPNTVVHGKISFIQYHGRNGIDISLEVFGLSSGLYGIFVYEKVLLGNDCIYNPKSGSSDPYNFRFVGKLFKPGYNGITRKNFRNQAISLPGEDTIIGYGTELYNIYKRYPSVCGVITNITASSVTSSTSTTSTPSTTTNDEMQSTLSYPVTSRNSTTSTPSTITNDEVQSTLSYPVTSSTSTTSTPSTTTNDEMQSTLSYPVTSRNSTTSTPSTITNDEVQSTLSYPVTSTTSTTSTPSTTTTNDEMQSTLSYPVTSRNSTTSTPSTITNDEVQSTLSYPVTSSTSTVEAENINETVIEEVEFVNISTSDGNRYSVYINDQSTNDEMQSALSYPVTSSTSTVIEEVEVVESGNISTINENRYVYIPDQINF